MTTDPTTDRAALIAGLRGLADFLEANPAVPVPESYQSKPISVLPPFRASDAERRAFVDAFAIAAGVEAADLDDSGHYMATAQFGPVEYRSYAISTAARDRADALDSYRDSIRLDDERVAA